MTPAHGRRCFYLVDLVNLVKHLYAPVTGEETNPSKERFKVMH